MSQHQPEYGSLRAVPRQNLTDTVPLRAPFTVYLEPTNVCNFKCSYCPVHFDDYAERSGGLNRMSVENCTRVYDEILTLGRLRTLNLYMLGEPFANRQLTEMIRIAKDKDVADRVIVTTNGTLIDEPTAIRTIESGLDYLRVSIYGSSQASMAAVTGAKIPLDRVLANVARLKRLRDERGATKPFIYTKMIETTSEDENQRFLDLFGPISDRAALEPAMNWNLSPDEQDFSGAGGDLMTGDYFKNRKQACPFPFYTLVINADLRVTVCCVDWEKATEVGHLGRQSLKEIWEGEALHQFRLKHLAGQRALLAGCSSCTFLHTAPDNMDGLSAAEFSARVSRSSDPRRHERAAPSRFRPPVVRDVPLTFPGALG